MNAGYVTRCFRIVGKHSTSKALPGGYDNNTMAASIRCARVMCNSKWKLGNWNSEMAVSMASCATFFCLAARIACNNDADVFCNTIELLAFSF